MMLGTLRSGIAVSLTDAAFELMLALDFLVFDL